MQTALVILTILAAIGSLVIKVVKIFKNENSGCSCSGSDGKCSNKKNIGC
ncbi:MAG: hypothetical protein HQK51_15025 [Oligoflexia bacterium]|nr:hypothetical protein [Oligoflexia bacterium]